MSLIIGAKVNSALGGTITNITGYTVHTFATSGIFTATTNGFVEVLVIGAGGGQGAPGVPSGGGYGGGGGAGAILYSKFIPVSAGVGYTVTVGTAGPSPGTPGVGGQGGNGGTSIFYYGGPSAPGTNITVPGGGGGGYGGFQPPRTPGGNGSNAPGASGGGGGGGNASAPPVGPPFMSSGFGGSGANVYGLGYDGGAGSWTPGNGGAGGGGAGGYGGVSPGPGAVPASGGNGVPYSFTGIAVTYSVGQGAGQNPSPATPGTYGSGGTPGAIIIRYPT